MHTHKHTVRSFFQRKKNNLQMKLRYILNTLHFSKRKNMTTLFNNAPYSVKRYRMVPGQCKRNYLDRRSHKANKSQIMMDRVNHTSESFLNHEQDKCSGKEYMQFAMTNSDVSNWAC